MPIRDSIRAIGVVLWLGSTAAQAQVELPRPSPLAKVSQVVGLTEVEVEYSSPAVRGRKIFGELVPYDKLWRTGANAATKLSLSKEATIGGQTVPAGTYSLFTIPSKTAWTIILNKNAKASTQEYKPELDAARFTLKPQTAPYRERLTFLFTGTTSDTTSLDLEWDKVKVAIPIKVATDTQAQTNLAGLDDAVWRQYNAAARYLLEQKKDYPAGLVYAQKSVAIKEDWLNLWTKAQLLAAMGRYREALPLAERVKALGEKAPVFFFEAEVKKALVEWKKKG